jgi:hypothetical protein
MFLSVVGSAVHAQDDYCHVVFSFFLFFLPQNAVRCTNVVSKQMQGHVIVNRNALHAHEYCKSSVCYSKDIFFSLDCDYI